MTWPQGGGQQGEARVLPWRSHPARCRGGLAASLVVVDWGERRALGRESSPLSKRRSLITGSRLAEALQACSHSAHQQAARPWHRAALQRRSGGAAWPAQVQKSCGARQVCCGPQHPMPGSRRRSADATTHGRWPAAAVRERVPPATAACASETTFSTPAYCVPTGLQGCSERVGDAGGERNTHTGSPEGAACLQHAGSRARGRRAHGRPSGCPQACSSLARSSYRFAWRVLCARELECCGSCSSPAVVCVCGALPLRWLQTSFRRTPPCTRLCRRSASETSPSSRTWTTARARYQTGYWS